MTTSNDLVSNLYSDGSAAPTFNWWMSHAERCAILHVLSQAKAPAAIEVGTAQGGCLDQIRRHVDFAVSIDIDPEVGKTLAPVMANVEFFCGNSKGLIPKAFELCAQRGKAVGFVLIDADHSYDAVQADIHAVLQHKPTRPVWILMHDSSDHICRNAIAQARWLESPFVHAVDLDFVPGTLAQEREWQGMLKGGLAIALLLPEQRKQDLTIGASASEHFRTVFRASLNYPSLANRIRWWRRHKLSKWIPWFDRA